MHIPDGFIDPKISSGFAGIAIGVISFCITKIKKLLPEKSKVYQENLVSNIGNTINFSNKIEQTLKNFSITANNYFYIFFITTLIFSCQMFNFPVNNGTSGHLVGGVLASVTTGPWVGTLIISIILVIQSLFFGDGGFFALGANIFNMAIIGSLGGYYLYYYINKFLPFKNFNFYISIFISGWLTVVLASISCSLQIAFSGKISLFLILPEMVKIHSIIGIAEAFITIFFISLFGILKLKIEGISNEKK